MASRNVKTKNNRMIRYAWSLERVGKIRFLITSRNNMRNTPNANPPMPATWPSCLSIFTSIVLIPVSNHRRSRKKPHRTQDSIIKIRDLQLPEAITHLSAMQDTAAWHDIRRRRSRRSRKTEAPFPDLTPSRCTS